MTATLALPSTAVAAPKPIKGKLSKGGYTVIAIAPNGRAVTADAKPSFKLKPPAKTVTLHLRNRAGRYAGPIVVSSTKKKVVMGLRAGATLGKVKIRKGFGVVRARPSDLVANVTARARDGVPIGARILGRVRGKVSGKYGLGHDYDRDGLPGAFDVDDDGDLIFDNVDRSLARVSANANVQAAVELYNARWVMNGGLQASYLADRMGYTHGVAGYTLNQNAAGPFAADAEFEKLRDLLMEQRGAIYMPLPGEESELDCGYRPKTETDPGQPGLSYCSPGGTGGAITRMQKFPDQFDADRDGMGTMTAVPRFAEGQDGLGLIQTVDPKTVFGIAPNAKEADIHAGDTYFERPVSKPDLAYPVVLRSVLGTLPALASWGDAARSQEPIDYPVPEGAEGSESKAFVVQRNAQGDYVLRLTIWRPQRKAVDGSGEGTGWIDLGGLTYTVVGKTAEQNRRLFKCAGSSYTTSDGNLSVTPSGLLDKAVDLPVNPANTLTFNVNLSKCLATSGIAWQPPGPTIDLFIAASSAFGDVVEGGGFSFKPGNPGEHEADFYGQWKFVGSVPSNEIEWLVAPNNGASTSRVGIIFYNGRTVTGGTPPDGWTCGVSNAGGQNDMYLCDGGPLEVDVIRGRTTLDAPYSTNTPVDMLICTDTCQGFGMRYEPDAR